MVISAWLLRIFSFEWDSQSLSTSSWNFAQLCIHLYIKMSAPGFAWIIRESAGSAETHSGRESVRWRDFLGRQLDAAQLSSWRFKMHDPLSLPLAPRRLLLALGAALGQNNQHWICTSEKLERRFWRVAGWSISAKSSQLGMQPTNRPTHFAYVNMRLQIARVNIQPVRGSLSAAGNNKYQAASATHSAVRPAGSWSAHD